MATGVAICFTIKHEAITGTGFLAHNAFVHQGDCTYMCAQWRTFLIASCQGQRLHCTMCGMSEGLHLQCLQLTPESRVHCVAAEGEQRHFHQRNFGFLSIRRAAGRVYMLVYSGDLWSSTGLHFPDNKW